MTEAWPSPGAASAVLLFALLGVAVVLALTGLSTSAKRLRSLVRQAPGNEQVMSNLGRGAPGLQDTAMMLELVAAMLNAGAGIGRALELVAAASSPGYRETLRPVVSALAMGADWETAWRSSAVRHPGILELRDALAFAALTGAPSSAILYAQAARLRRERFRAAEKRAASLGVKLVVPLGLCSLPAFICLGVVPVLLALVPA